MNGIALKEKTLARAEALGRRAADTAPGRVALGAFGYGAASFLLSALPLFARPLPLGACLILCGSSWTAVLGSLLGASGGYVLLWGWEAAMEPLALALSCCAAAGIFRRTPISRSVLTAALTAAVGGLFLLDTGLSLVGILRLPIGCAMAALLPRLWERALERGEPRAQLGAGALMLLAASSLGGAVGPLLALGTALLLPELRSLPVSPVEPLPLERPGLSAQKSVEKALHTMHSILARDEPILPPLQLAEVYDFAAEQVCRCCVNFSRCWEQNAEETYQDLCTAGEAILQRGAAEREDLPPRFTDRCCHTAGFLTAVNQSLDELLSRRRESRRRAEGRRIAAGQYLTFEHLLTALTRPQPRGALRFVPELAVGTACKTGNQVSGDRGATCKDRFGCFYVLLCDGMGTGVPARGESDRAARLLTAFLETGMEADAAMDLINGFYVLRRDSAFATMDLLKLDLRTGNGTLYKWGAAPSYLRRGETVEKIGTVTPPPGLDAAERRVPGQYALSLREGETLVMVSDGAFGEETAQRLTEFSHGSVRDLASCLITLGASDAADDRTAVVLRLRPLPSATGEDGTKGRMRNAG